MGYIADSIVNDYKREQAFKKKAKRQKCALEQCTECPWKPVCEDREETEDDNRRDN